MTIANTLAEAMSLPGEQWQILAALGSCTGQAAEIVQVLAARIDDEDLRAGFLRGRL